MKRTVISEQISSFYEKLEVKNLPNGYVCRLLTGNELEKAKQIEVLSHSLGPSSGVEFSSSAQLKDLDRIFRAYLNKEQILCLFSDKEDYVGHIGFSIEDEFGKIAFLSIQPKYQGRGFSMILLKKTIGLLMEREVRQIQASTSNTKLMEKLNSLNVFHREEIEYKYFKSR